ncbi:hypothetical protein D3C78_1097710 [compost metagenome]
MRGPVGQKLVLGRALEHVHADIGMRPFQKLRPHLFGNADHAGDHRHRDDIGIRGEQLGFALALEGIDQVVGEFLDFRLHLVDMPGNEGAVDERAQPRVLRRLQLQKRMLLGGVEMLHMFQRLRQADFLAASHMQDLPSEAAVAQKCADMVVTGEEPLPLLLPVKGGTLPMQGGINRVRIVVEGRVAGVE